MTKAELVEEVSRVSDLTKKHSELIVDTVFQSIIDALNRGEKIELRGFGSFRLRQREPRKGRNPKTGDKVDVPPKKVPYFKPGKELKELINKDGLPAERHGAFARRAAGTPLNCGFGIADCGLPIANPTQRQSVQSDPQSAICNPQFRNGSPLLPLASLLRDHGV